MDKENAVILNFYLAKDLSILLRTTPIAQTRVFKIIYLGPYKPA